MYYSILQQSVGFLLGLYTKSVKIKTNPTACFVIGSDGIYKTMHFYYINDNTTSIW